MDSALACCAVTLGLIPTIGTSKKVCKHSVVFSPSRYKVVGQNNATRRDNLRILASTLSRKNIVVLATPFVSKHRVSARNGRKMRPKNCARLPFVPKIMFV